MGLRLDSFRAPLPLHRPYVLEAEQGTTLAIVGSGSAVRYLATGQETNDLFAVVQSRGRCDDVVPAHFHRVTHDVFLVTQGTLELYCGDQVRVLTAGDFASVPPTVPHAYQIIAPDTEFLGLITPGSWITFFGHIGEAFDSSPLYPAMMDKRFFPFELFIEAIKAGNDVVPLRDFDYTAARGDASAEENALPGVLVPYYLRASAGPSHLLGSQSCTPLATHAETGGEFTTSLIAGIETSFPGYNLLASPSHQPLQCASPFLARCVEGVLTFELDGGPPETLTAKESIFVPTGTNFTCVIKSAYARMYVFTGAGAGLAEVFALNGRLVEAGGKHEVLGESDEWRKTL